jgi:hypothetical protein
MRLLFFYLFFYLFIGCKGQSQKSDCNSYYDNAKMDLSNYSSTSDTVYLNKAQISLDSALECLDIRKKVIKKKNQVFIIQEKYLDGVNFMNTLENADFEFPYQKQMYVDYLRGIYYGSINDIKKKDSIFTQSVINIQKHIDKQNYETIESGKTVFYNLFFTKSRIYDSLIINKEIDSLKKKYPNEGIIIEDLRKVIIESIDY